MKKRLFLLLLSASGLFAKDFGARAETFPVEEKDLIEWIQENLQGQEEEMQRYLEETKSYVEAPPPVVGIGKATRRRSFTMDPSYTVPEDELLSDGTVLFRKGDVINPLRSSVVEDFLFFDGTDPDQIAWARTSKDNAIWCLIKGDPRELEEKEGRPVFYDQRGLYTSKFNVKSVPARVSQQGDLLLVEEIPLKEGL